MFIFLVITSSMRKEPGASTGSERTRVQVTKPQRSQETTQTKPISTGTPTSSHFKILLVRNENFYREALAEVMEMTFKDNPDGNSYEIVHAAYLTEVEAALQHNDISLVVTDDFGTDYDVKKVAEAANRLSPGTKVIVYDFDLGKVDDDLPKERRQELHIIQLLDPAYCSARILAEFIQEKLKK